MSNNEKPVRLTRIIARLNVGGPAIQAIMLTWQLEALGYQTRLVRGSESATEGNMNYLADRLGVAWTLVSEMRRDPGPADAAALVKLIRILREDRPQIVHTHAAKAGTLGRIATLISFPRRRPILVHTFHGHSLTGYFSSRTATLFLAIERWLAQRTDVLVAVSPEVRDDLARLGVAEARRFVVIPLGFDLTGFTDDLDRAKRRSTLRSEWGIADDEEVVMLIARLVPIKRVDRFLRVAKRLAQRPRTRFVVVGDGEVRDTLAASTEAVELGDRLVWAGFRRDMPDVCFASDVVMLTSDNEGTPVSLIEAQAAGVPVVGTDVGGIRSAVLDDTSGYVLPADDESGLAAAVSRILSDPALAARMAAAGREHVRSSYALERLVDDHDRLYRQLLRTDPG